MSSIAISCPSIYEPIVESDDASIAVEHARLNCRMLELVLGCALRDGLDHKKVVVFIASGFPRAKHLFTRWTKSLCKDESEDWFKWSTRVNTCEIARFGPVWLVGGTMFSVEDLPFPSADVIYGVSCERMSVDVSAFFPEAKTFLAGEFAPKDHWFYSWARRSGTSLHRISGPEIVGAFPDQEIRALPSTDPYFKRLHLLEDVEPVFTPVGFMVFSRRRLWVKTDKPLEFLSSKQQEIAKGQRGTPIVPMEVTALQRRYLAWKRKCKAEGKRPWRLVLKYRRGGITSTEQGESYYAVNTVPHSSVLTLAHTAKSTSRIWKMVDLMYERDPNKIRRNSDAKSSLELENGSSFFVATAGGHGVARGDTLQRSHGSEVSKWCLGPSQIEQQEDLIAGISGACENGDLTLETTPNGHEWFWREWQLIKKGQSEFSGCFLRWFDDPINRCKIGEFDAEELYETLTDQEKELIHLHKLDPAQIAYRRKKKREYKRLFPQEMPEDDITCFLASGTCYFDTDLIMQLLRKLPENEGKRSHVPGGYEIRWREPIRGREYIAGCDTSEGLPGCDLNGVGIIDRETGEQVCSLHGLFNPRMLAHLAVDRCREYNDALLGIERQNHGHAVLQKVADLGYDKPYWSGGSLYYMTRSSNIKHGHIDVGDQKYGRAGWSTEEDTRAIMLQDLAEAVESGAMKVHDRDFLSEMLAFRLQKSGKFEADSGAHDDTIFKWGIAWQMRKFRKMRPSVSFGG